MLGMEAPQYKVGVIYEPSDHLREQAEGLGVDSAALMRDYLSISIPKQESGESILPSAEQGSGGLIVAVGDMANNIIGTSVEDAELARKLGLPEGYKFNGGLFASHSLRRWMAYQRDTGVQLIEQANQHLRGLYKKFGMESRVFTDAAARFTGCLAHMHSGPDTDGHTIFTAVGDVKVWANGEHVAGVTEKEIDALKEKLVNELTGIVWSSPVGDVEHTIRKFADRVGLDNATIEEFKGRIFSARELPPAEQGRQVIYRPVDDLITPWQIRTLQNPTQDSDSTLYYGAVDGTSTPQQFIQVRAIPTGDIDTVVIATDGLKPTDESVRSLDDLTPTNVEYGEQTAVALRRVR